MRILLVGYGRMGRLVGDLAGEYECEVAGIVDPQLPSHSASLDDERWRDVDVAIDFSLPEAVPINLPALARLGVNVVVGTTGWRRFAASSWRPGLALSLRRISRRE
jgi:4-hydroxy-tetrahydrodipicolinate reductase